MKIFVSHYRHMDFENELYKPLRESELAHAHEFIFPHEGDRNINTKELIKKVDLVIAEISHSATGVGIELGWADAFGRPILCIYKVGSKPPNSVNYLTNSIAEYSDSDDLVRKVSDFITNI